ncbi:hypothetical protein ILUMI_20280, partial [Ignelater luminosus]
MMEIGESDEDFTATPPNVSEAATSEICNLLPQKSKMRYENTYNQFKEWRQKHKAGKKSENVLLAYLQRTL